MKDVIKIDGVDYIPKSNVSTKVVMPKTMKGMDFCIIRTYSAGVFAGFYNRKTKGKEGTIYNAIRLWYWKGACSLSQLANDGVKEPNDCKFAQAVKEIDLKEIIEIIPCTKKAKDIIESVKKWEK